jgi:hypothetical protein
MNMRHLLLLTFGLLISINLSAANLFSIKNNKVVPTHTYKLLDDNDRDHSAKNYKLIDTKTVSAGNGYTYDIKSYQHKEDDLDLFGDSIFSKIKIVCHKPIATASNGAKGVKNFVFFNVNEWLRFNYWSFAPYSDNPRFENGREAFKVYNLSSDCVAIVIRGFRDSVSPPELTIFILYKDSAVLVYNGDHEINSISTEGASTTMNLEKLFFDDDGKAKSVKSTMIFGLGNITLK